MQLLPFWFSALCSILPAFQCLLSVGRLLDFTHLPLAALWSGNFLQAMRWGIYKAHLICFLTPRSHYFSLSGTQCLENHRFIYFAGYFSCLRWGCKSSACYPISAGCRNPMIDPTSYAQASWQEPRHSTQTPGGKGT